MNRIALVVVLALAVTNSLCQNYKRPIKLVVNYESLCPDSIRFINNGLSQARNLFGNQLDIKLIPFGNADVINNRFY